MSSHYPMPRLIISRFQLQTQIRTVMRVHKSLSWNARETSGADSSLVSEWYHVANRWSPSEWKWFTELMRVEDSSPSELKIPLELKTRHLLLRTRRLI